MSPRILTALALSVFLLASCAGQNPAGQPGVTGTPAGLPQATQAPPPTAAATAPQTQATITLWHSWDEADMPLLVQIIDQFQAQHPDVLFDVLYVPAEVLKARFETATGEDSGPTVLLAPAQWGPELYEAGLLSDLNGLEVGDLRTRLNQAALGTGEYRGALVSLPYEMQGVVLYRNKSLVPEPPATFDELISVAKNTTRGEQIGAMLERSFFFAGAHLNGLGGQVMGEDGEPLFNDRLGLEWARLLVAFEQAGPPAFLSDQDVEFFKAGRVGWIVDGTWNLKDLRESLGADNLAIDPWPAVQNGFLSGYVQTDSVFLSAKAGPVDREAAGKFIQYLLSSEAQSALGGSGRIPTASDVPVVDPLVTQAMSALAGGATYPSQPEFGLYQGPMDVALKSIYEGVDPAQAFQAAQESISNSLSSFRLTPAP